jgi:hypothetical protein
MDEATARAMIRDHFDASTITVAGGGPRDDIALRFRDLRRRRPAGVPPGRRAHPRQGQHHRHEVRLPRPPRLPDASDDRSRDLWVNEYSIRYDEKPVNVVGIMEFRDDKVVRERIYFGEPWEPPAWRAQWAEPMEEPEASEASG